MGQRPQAQFSLKKTRGLTRRAAIITCRVAFLVMLAALPALSAAQNTPPTASVPAALVPAGAIPAEAQPQTTARLDHAPAQLSETNRRLGLPAPSTLQPTSEKPQAPATAATLVRTATSLTAVVALILLAAFVVRSLARRQGGIMAAVGPGGRAPSGVVEVLARYPVARSQTLILLKLPRRVIVLAQTRGVRGASSLAALSEIVDAEEIADLVHRTREADNQTIARKFGSILNTEQRGLAKILGAFTPNTNAPSVTTPELPLSFPATRSRTSPRRVTTSPSGDRVELSSTPDATNAQARSKPNAAKRGYTDAPPATPPRSDHPFTDADLQQRLAALRQIALERNRRAS